MTFTGSLEWKSRYLSEHACTFHVRLLERTFRQRVVSELGQGSVLPRGAWGSLELDLIYCIVKHSHWLSAPIFKDVVVEFVVADYRIPREISSRIVQIMLDAYLDVCPIPDTPISTTDRDFLRYIFVMASSAPDGRNLVAELGLGSTLLQRIRRAAESLKQSRGSEADTACFLPEIDALLTEIMCEISQEMKTTPWVADVHRLHYRLAANDSFWQTELEHHGAHRIFEVLLQLGRNGPTRSGTVAHWCAEKRLELPEKDAGKAEGFTTALNRAKLAYPVSGAAGKNSKNDRWKLSREGEELTARAFAHHLLQRGSLEPPAVLALTEPYQAAVITEMEDTSVLEELVASRPLTLTPAGLRCAFARLETVMAAEKRVELLEEVVSQNPSPWVRKAACDILAASEAGTQASRIAINAAEHDPSPTVRHAALDAALNTAQDEDRPHLTRLSSLPGEASL